MHRRTPALTALTLAALAGGAWLLLRADPQPTVIFVVLDTIRADHLSLCGYERPTSPALEALRDRGASWTCDAVSPGTWTAPSHASFFTGLGVTEHGVHTFGGTASGVAEEGLVAGALTHGVFPMPRNVETLAETFSARGYQTLAVSANPVVSDHLELTRGFTYARAAKSFEEAYAELLLVDLEGALRQAPPERGPLFLFVNIADAHIPWRGVPRGVDWLPSQEGMTYKPEEREGDWSRFVRGEMPPDEGDALVTRATDLYDYSVFEADQALGEVLALVERAGWMSGGWRLVVVSDHGEMLGEHGLLAHGHTVYEPNAKVPLLYLDSEGAAVDLRGPFPAIHAYHLARDGELPASLRPVEVAAFPGASWATWSEGWFAADPEAAVWEGTQKLTWKGGSWLEYDLEGDPGELQPTVTGEQPEVLKDLIYRMDMSASRKGDVDEATLEMLRAAGYIE